MKKIIITENQLSFIGKEVLSEAVGVPKYILESGEKLYKIVSDNLKEIKTKEKKYSKIIETELKVSDEEFRIINLNIFTEEIEDYDGDVVLASVGVGNFFKFDESIMMQINLKNNEIDLNLNFVTPRNWKPSDLYDTFTSEKVKNTSVMAHELKHKFDRQKKQIEKIGGTANYQAFSSGGLRFGIPVLDRFMRYSYFIQNTENLVRPTELASKLIQQNITREQFYDFIVNDPLYLELKEIREFSFDFLINKLYNQMDRVDALIRHTGRDPKNIEDKDKIMLVLDLFYLNITNVKVEKFDDIFFNEFEKITNFMRQLSGGQINLQLKPNKEKIRSKYLNRTSRYAGREIDFFKEECERFNYVATNIMKKISKVYALIPDEKEETNESILNWDLHQELMEKKYGKRKIDTEYNFKRR